MIKFLLDANLSPLTAHHLRDLGYDTASLIELQLHGLQDSQVVDLAIKQRRLIITFDQDFGEIYYHQRPGKFGVIVLRINNQTIEAVNQTLQQFLDRYQHKLLQKPKTLVIVKTNSVRFVK